MLYALGGLIDIFEDHQLHCFPKFLPKKVRNLQKQPVFTWTRALDIHGFTGQEGQPVAEAGRQMFWRKECNVCL